MKLLYNFLIFPGFLFTAVVGLLASWVDRKVTARVQWRKGPPWYQNFADFLKLLGKETVIPQGASRGTFMGAPLIALAAVTLVSFILGMTILNPQRTFIGDLIVLIYLLTIPSLMIVLGASASNNPLASLGASREMKLILGYELPFVLAALVPIIKSGSIRMGEILNYQVANGVFLGQLSGIIAFVVVIFCLQAKLGFVPFDIPEAETEIMAGAYIEYGGPLLAVFRLTRAMMLVVLPMFLVSLFWAETSRIWFGLLKYVIILVVIVLIRNTNPRVRIDQAMKFFWVYMSPLAALAIILAFLGL